MRRKRNGNLNGKTLVMFWRICECLNHVLHPNMKWCLHQHTIDLFKRITDPQLLFHYLMPTNDYQSYVGLNNLYAKKVCVAATDGDASTSHGDLVLNVTIDCIVSIGMSGKCGSTSFNIELLFVWCGIKDIAPIRSLRSLSQCDDDDYHYYQFYSLHSE
eukprot:106931_1